MVRRRCGWSRPRGGAAYRMQPRAPLRAPNATSATAHPAMARPPPGAPTPYRAVTHWGAAVVAVIRPGWESQPEGTLNRPRRAPHLPSGPALSRSSPHRSSRHRLRRRAVLTPVRTPSRRRRPSTGASRCRRDRRGSPRARPTRPSGGSVRTCLRRCGSGTRSEACAQVSPQLLAARSQPVFDGGSFCSFPVWRTCEDRWYFMFAAMSR